jgi:signal transduction histidine kinase
VDVDEVVDETLQIIQGHREMRGVSLERKRGAKVKRIWADRDQVQQILVNLLLNALDALEGEGRIVVSTGMTEVLPEEELLSPPPRRKGEPRDADYTPMRRLPPVAFLTGKKGPYVFIRVEDTGCGIPEAEFRRIFEPFYTTKEPGKGTGLGLTVCQGIVESYGGRIHVSSNEGSGSCFTVYLPVGNRDERWKDRREGKGGILEAHPGGG